MSVCGQSLTSYKIKDRGNRDGSSEPLGDSIVGNEIYDVYEVQAGENS